MCCLSLVLWALSLELPHYLLCGLVQRLGGSGPLHPVTPALLHCQERDPDCRLDPSDMVMSLTCLMSSQGSVASRINARPLSWHTGPFLIWPQSSSSGTLPVPFPNAFCDLTMHYWLQCRHPVLSLLSLPLHLLFPLPQMASSPVLTLPCLENISA